jgi:hypothetical protein
MAHNANGTTLMEASGSFNVPVIEASETTSELRLVGTYNMAPISAGAREAYARFTFSRGEDKTPIYLTVGRFNVPFGLLTDEHRTYTRIQTNSSINNFFEGAAISGNIIPSLSYDFAIVNDLQTGSNFNNIGTSYALIANFRWMSPFFPFILGVSQLYDYLQNQSLAFASSAYTVVSIDRLSSNKIPLAILYETVIARNWNNSTTNPGLGSFFIPSTDSNYQNALNSSESLGLYGTLRYDLNSRWMFFYKFDHFVPDMLYSGDHFDRHGLGCEITLNSNAYLNVRYERAIITRPEISGSNILAAQDDIFAMLRFWL